MQFDAQTGPLINIVVPVLNEAAWLTSLLDHLAQLHTPHRTIVIDGGSSDNSMALAQKHAHPQLVEQVCGGRHCQLNRGLELSTAPILLFCAADLRLSSKALPAIIAAAQNGASHGALKQQSSNKRFRLQDSTSFLRAQYCQGAYMDQAPWFTRQALLKINGFEDCGPYDSAHAGYRIGKGFQLAHATAISSCRAWDKNFLTSSFVNQKQRLAYFYARLFKTACNAASLSTSSV